MTGTGLLQYWPHLACKLHAVCVCVGGGGGGCIVCTRVGGRGA